MDIVNQILLRTFLILLFVGSLGALLLGAGMLFQPQQVANLNQYFSRWFSTESFGKQFDKPRWVEKLAYRYHRVVGGVVFVGALFILYTFLFHYNIRRISAAFPPGSWRLVDAMVGLLIAGGLVAALVGLIILTRPSLLRDVEQTTNAWVSTDGILNFFNVMRNGMEHEMLRYPRLIGGIIVAGSLFTLVVMVRLYWRHGFNI